MTTPSDDDEIFVLDPTKPMSDEERIKHITNIILEINDIEKANLLAKIILKLLKKNKQ